MQTKHSSEATYSHINSIKLSPRQLSVIELRANGFHNKQIAERLGIRECTVKEHITAALNKTKARNVEHAILCLARSGIIR